MSDYVKWISKYTANKKKIGTVARLRCVVRLGPPKMNKTYKTKIQIKLFSVISRRLRFTTLHFLFSIERNFQVQRNEGKIRIESSPLPSHICHLVVDGILILFPLRYVHVQSAVLVIGFMRNAHISKIYCRRKMKFTCRPSYLFFIFFVSFCVQTNN